MADGKIDIELEIKADKAKKDAPKTAKEIGKSIGDSLQSGAKAGSDKVANELGTKLPAEAAKSGAKAGSSFSKAISAGFSTISFDSISKGLSSIGDSAGRLGDTLTNSITKPALLAVTAVGGIATALVGKAGWSRLIEIDTAQAKLKALGHTAEGVTEISENARQAVLGTAFGLNEAVTVAASAVAAGVGAGADLTRYLTLVGDTAAVAGAGMSDMGSIFNKVQGSGKAMTLELNRLNAYGIPIVQYLAAEFGKTAAEIYDMAQEGEISSEIFFNAIEKNIGGAAKVMGQESFMGAISNIGASLARVGANFLDAGKNGEGMFSQVKPLLTELLGYLGNVEVAAKDFGTAFGQAFAQMVQWVRDNADDIGAFATQVGENFNQVVEVIGKFAKSAQQLFGSLSKDQQDFIMQMLLIAPVASIAFGPMLKLMKPILNIAGSLVSGMGKVSAKVAEVGVKATAASGGLKLVSAASAGLKLGMIGLVTALAAVAAGFAVAEFVKYRKRQDDLKTATEGLTKSTDAFADSFSKVGASAKDTGLDAASSSLRTYRDDLDKTIEKQAELARENTETWSNIGADTALLMGYADTIEQLAGKTEGSADKQKDLALAVAGYNQITGEHIQIIDSATGTLDISTDAIMRNADAWVANAKVQAAQEEMVELQRIRIGLNKDLAASEGALETANTNLKNAQEDQRNGMGISNETILGFRTEVYKAEEAVRNANDAINANEQDVKKLGEIYYEASSQVKLSADEIKKYIDANGELSQKFADLEIDVGGFSQKLSDLGLTQGELSQLSGPQIQTLVDDWANGGENIAGILEAYRQDINYSFDTQTHEAVEAAARNIAAGKEPTAAEVALLAKAIKDPMEGTKAALDEETRLAIDGIINNIRNGKQLTAEESQLLVDGLKAPIEELPIYAEGKGAEFINALDAKIASGEPTVGASAGTVGEAAKGGIASAPDFAGIIGDTFVGRFNSPLSSAAGTFESATRLPAEADSGARSKDGGGAGDNFAAGFITAIGGWIGRAFSAGWDLISSALSGGNAAQESASPAKKTKLIGKWFSLGFINELGNRENEAYSAGYDFTKASIDGMNAAMTNISTQDAIKASMSANIDISNATATINAAIASQQLSAATTQPIINNTLVIDGAVINDDQRMGEVVIETLDYARSKGLQ